MNRLKAYIKDFSVGLKLFLGERVLAHVNRHMYTSWWTCFSLMLSAPVKSTPVTEKGGLTLSLETGSGGGSGVFYCLLVTFLQMTHLRRTIFTCCLIHGIQNFRSYNSAWWYCICNVHFYYLSEHAIENRYSVNIYTI
jgi:hypothetical protein